MVKMNKHRIQNWKCLQCGSRMKRRIDVIGSSGSLIGYSLLCCNCGHLDNFALNTAAIEMFVCGNEAKAEKMHIYCPFSENDVDGYCNNKKCKYRPTSTITNKSNISESKASSIKPVSTTPLMVERKKYT